MEKYRLNLGGFMLGHIQRRKVPASSVIGQGSEEKPDRTKLDSTTRMFLSKTQWIAVLVFSIGEAVIVAKCRSYNR